MLHLPAAVVQNLQCFPVQRMRLGVLRKFVLNSCNYSVLVITEPGSSVGTERWIHDFVTAVGKYFSALHALRNTQLDEMSAPKNKLRHNIRNVQGNFFEGNSFAKQIKRSGVSSGNIERKLTPPWLRSCVAQLSLETSRELPATLDCVLDWTPLVDAFCPSIGTVDKIPRDAHWRRRWWWFEKPQQLWEAPRMQFYIFWGSSPEVGQSPYKVCTRDSLRMLGQHVKLKAWWFLNEC